MGVFTRNHYYTVDMDKPLTRRFCGILLASGDNNGDEFFFTLKRDGVDIAQSGETLVTAYFIRSDGVTVPLEGVNVNNLVHVSLDESCYTREGNFALTVKITLSGMTTTLAIIDGFVRLTTTDSIVDPAETITSLEEILEKLKEIEESGGIGGGGTVDVDATLSVAGKAADAAATGNAIGKLSEGLADKVTAPVTAEVGQIIAVSEVDESGKPTAWETTDYSKLKTTGWVNACEYGLVPGKWAQDAGEIINQLLKDSTVAVVYVPNGIYYLDTPIVINESNKTLQFDPYVHLVLRGGRWNANININAFEIGVDKGKAKPTNITLINPRAMGLIKSGGTGAGILIKGCGMRCVIRNPYMDQFDAGIRTEFFDCNMCNEIYEPYLYNNRLGLDDAAGGLQACRIYGGRIEGNNSNGIYSSSPNVRLFGTIIEANGEVPDTTDPDNPVYPAEVFLIRGARMGHSPKFEFIGVYFENNTASRIVEIKDTDMSYEEAVESGYAGTEEEWAESYATARVNFTNCMVYSQTAGAVLLYCEDNIALDFSLYGGTTIIDQMFYLPEANASSEIRVFDIAQPHNTAEVLPVNTDVNPEAYIFFFDRQCGTHSQHVYAKNVFGMNGVFTPAEHVQSKRYIVNTLDSGEVLYCTCSLNAKPWTLTDSGQCKGSMHYVVADKTCYVRVELVADGAEDEEANWSQIFGVQATAE